MRAFAESLNDADPPPAWLIYVGAISDQADFWEAIEPYENRLTELRFDPPVPNILDMKDNLEKELREIRDEEQAQQVTYVLSSQTRPLRPRTKRVEALVKRVDAGAGRIVAKAKRKKIYDSDTRIKKAELDRDVDGVVNNLAAQIRRWFRR